MIAPTSKWKSRDLSFRIDAIHRILSDCQETAPPTTALAAAPKPVFLQPASAQEAHRQSHPQKQFQCASLAPLGLFPYPIDAYEAWRHQCRSPELPCDRDQRFVGGVRRGIPPVPVGLV